MVCSTLPENKNKSKISKRQTIVQVANSVHDIFLQPLQLDGGFAPLITAVGPEVLMAVALTSCTKHGYARKRPCLLLDC